MDTGAILNINKEAFAGSKRARENKRKGKRSIRN